MTINEVLDRFVAEQPSEDHRSAIELYRSYLDTYAYETLEHDDRVRWERAHERDEEAGSFCNLFGPERILEGLEPFLGWFVIRKVLGPPGVGEAAAHACRDLVRWMLDEDYVDERAADGAIELTDEAARALPAAEELSSVLYEETELNDGEPLEVVDWESELAVITKVERRRLWFASELGEVGPVLVPERATELARPGWGLSAPSFGRFTGGWKLLEMGSVYPD